MSHSYRELIVWQRAMDLAQDVYAHSKKFPKEEIYGLTSQLRRAAVSVASNIAEGQGRLNKGEFRQFLGQARGSLLEVGTQLELAMRLQYITASTHVSLDARIQEILRMLNALISKLES